MPLIGTSVGDLKSELAVEVKFKKPKILMKALKITRIKKDQFQDLRKSYFEIKKPPPMVSKFGTNKYFSKDFLL